MTIEELEIRVANLETEVENLTTKLDVLMINYAKLNRNVTISVYEFFERFTDEEFAAFITAKDTELPLKILYEKIQVSQDVTLSEQSVINGMDLLVQYEIITDQRKQEILLP